MIEPPTPELAKECAYAIDAADPDRTLRVAIGPAARGGFRQAVRFMAASGWIRLVEIEPMFPPGSMGPFVNVYVLTAEAIAWRDKRAARKLQKAGK